MPIRLSKNKGLLKTPAQKKTRWPLGKNENMQTWNPLLLSLFFHKKKAALWAQFSSSSRLNWYLFAWLRHTFFSSPFFFLALSEIGEQNMASNIQDFLSIYHENVHNGETHIQVIPRLNPQLLWRNSTVQKSQEEKKKRLVNVCSTEKEQSSPIRRTPLIYFNCSASACLNLIYCRNDQLSNPYTLLREYLGQRECPWSSI